MSFIRLHFNSHRGKSSISKEELATYPMGNEKAPLPQYRFYSLQSDVGTRKEPHEGHCANFLGI